MSTTSRQKAWDREVARSKELGLGELPICNLCGCPVGIGQAWDESHDPLKARAQGGTDTGVAHRKCNRDHGAQIVTPQIAKEKRIRARHTGAYRSLKPLPCGRHSQFKKRMDGTVVDRFTGEPIR